MDQDEETLNFSRMHYMCSFTVIPKSCLKSHHRGSPSSTEFEAGLPVCFEQWQMGQYLGKPVGNNISAIIFAPFSGKLYASAV